MIIVYKIVVFSGFRTRAHGIPTQVRYQLYHIAVIARFRVSSLFNYRLYANSTIEQNKIKCKDTSITHFSAYHITYSFVHTCLHSSFLHQVYRFSLILNVIFSPKTNSKVMGEELHFFYKNL